MKILMLLVHNLLMVMMMIMMMMMTMTIYHNHTFAIQGHKQVKRNLTKKLLKPYLMPCL